MKPEIKKQIILHLPYLAFVYLFGKVGQAFRLAQGADLSAKLLHIGQGFSAAFASAAPSFHPTDLLIGLAAAVIKTAQAEMLILELLADGKKMPSAELEKTVNERGISSRTMRTAKSRIGDRLVTEKDGTAWVCYLRD